MSAREKFKTQVSVVFPNIRLWIVIGRVDTCPWHLFASGVYNFGVW